MISTQLFSINFESDDFEKEIETSLNSNRFSLLIRCTRGKKLFLLDAILKIGRKEIDIVPKPISVETGLIRISLGHIPASNFKVYFRMYSVEKVSKVKVFLIDDTNEKILKTTPSGNKTKELSTKELWKSQI